MSLTFPIRALILDMDGVLWHDERPIGDLPAVFARIKAAGLRVVLATNNSTRAPEEYLEKLRAFGVSLTKEQVINSSMATAAALKKRFPEGGVVYVVGERGILSALREAGFTPKTGADRPQNPVAVVAGMDRDISYEKLEIATQLVRAGAPFYATNPDRTYPTPRGLAPGAGTIIAALEASTDTTPIMGGKPEPYLFRLALRRMEAAASETLVVGDRLETDIAGGQAAGCQTALVLSGVTPREKAEAWTPPIDLIAENLDAVLDVLESGTSRGG
jgi:4-nitrophenyl phosphatase